MKKLNLNKKGFTLIELLAVIVILALLVAVAVPSVTRYLNTARKGVMSTDAATAISAVRTEVMASNKITGGAKTVKFDIDNINNLLEASKNLKTSPYGGTYTGYVNVKYEDGSYEYCININDGTYGIKSKEIDLNQDSIKLTEELKTNTECSDDADHIATVSETGLSVDPKKAS